MRRLCAVLAVAIAVILASAVGSTAAGAGGTDPVAQAAAKKCKRGFALLRSDGKRRCVRRCPSGYVKKRVGTRRVCVKKPKPTVDDGGGTGGGETVDGGGGGTVDDGGQPPSTHDPAAAFASILSRLHLLRTYQVPKPGAHSGYNTHSEEYGWCTGNLMAHHYEGIAYIYESAGHYTILSGSASEDGSTGNGVIQFTQEQANFDEERGKVQEIQISWTGDVATVVHPEIGTNDFAKTVRSTDSCTR